MSKVYFTDPVKVNCWTERAHIVWVDKVAAEQNGTRQGMLRQILDGVMNFTTANPAALAAILGYASTADTPLRTRKPKEEKPVEAVQEPEAPKRPRGRPKKVQQ